MVNQLAEMISHSKICGAYEGQSIFVLKANFSFPILIVSDVATQGFFVNTTDLI